jgi:L-fuculose-phosphate aldolase
MRWVVEEILKAGKLLFSEGLVSARAGNLSRAFGSKLYITRTGSNLGDLTEADVLELPLTDSTPLDERASVELDVHRSIVTATGKRAVVHAHPPYAVALSLRRDDVILPDYEGKAVLGEVPLLDPIGLPRQELVQKITELLREHSTVLLKGHGVFSADSDLMKAYSYVSTLEHSCRLAMLSYT